MIDKNDSMGLLIYNVHEISQQYRQKLKFMLGRSQEAVVRRCSVKKVFLEISQNSQENTCGRVFFFNKKNFIKNFIKK